MTQWASVAALLDVCYALKAAVLGSSYSFAQPVLVYSGKCSRPDQVNSTRARQGPHSHWYIAAHCSLTAHEMTKERASGCYVVPHAAGQATTSADTAQVAAARFECVSLHCARAERATASLRSTERPRERSIVLGCNRGLYRCMAD